MAAAGLLLSALLSPLAAVSASAAGLDVSTGYRMRALRYTHLDLQAPRADRSFLSQDAKLGLAVRNIHLTSQGVEETAMDVALDLHAVGVAGSTTSFQPPFDRIADHYPNASFVPFIQNAYVRTRGLFGKPVEVTFGQQPFTLGSGLLLADDGVGLAGVSARGTLPWWELKLEGYAFQPRNSQTAGNSLTVYGASVELPTEGTWQLHQMFERDKTNQFVAGNLASKAVRSFTSLRYQISFGPLFFDGEAAFQKGSATPTGPTPAGNHITYNGNAQVVRAKWKQSFWKGGEGIARLTGARGSGDDGGTLTTDEAFFPSRGHRFDGLERSGFGEFFGATPYDAFGGQSTATASGLPRGASGIVSVGLGFTPPAYRGITVDFDYWLFQADRNVGPHRTLGTELDLRLRYGFRDRFNLAASAALFTAGPAIGPGKASARRYLFEASGRF